MKIVKSKLKGVRPYAYWIQAMVESENECSMPFACMIDTGTFISLIPDTVAPNNNPLPLAPISTRAWDGRKQKVCPRKITISIDGHSYTPEKGVIVAKADYGLIGFDILDEMNLRISDGVMLIEYAGAG